MSWLEDKKNLPFVIGGAVVMILVAGYILFSQLRGPQIPNMPQTAAPSQPVPDQSAASAPATSPGSSAPAANSAPPATSAGGPPTSMPPGGPGGGNPAATTPAAPGGDATAQAGTGKPKPMLVWRPDPFALDTTKGPKGPPPVHRLAVPMPARVFEAPTVRPEDIFRQVLPEPVRRVAGIMIGDRVRALIQTPDGWEMVKAGDPLKDGSIVERIERDRVFIRQIPPPDSKEKPRLLVVRLAGEIPQSTTATTTAPSTGGSRRSPVPYRRGGPLGPPGNTM